MISMTPWLSSKTFVGPSLYVALGYQKIMVYDFIDCAFTIIVSSVHCLFLLYELFLLEHLLATSQPYAVDHTVSRVLMTSTFP